MGGPLASLTLRRIITIRYTVESVLPLAKCGLILSRLVYTLVIIQNRFHFIAPTNAIKIYLNRALKTVTEEDTRKFPMINGEGKKVMTLSPFHMNISFLILFKRNTFLWTCLPWCYCRWKNVIRDTYCVCSVVNVICSLALVSQKTLKRWRENGIPPRIETSCSVCKTC